MVTARFFLGAFLFVVLIVDTCSTPVKKGQKFSSDQNVAANFASNQGTPSSHVLTGHLLHNAQPSYVSMPVAQPSFSQPAVQVEPAASVDSSYLRPVQSGYSVTTQPGAAATAPAQPEIPVDWVLPPPAIFSRGEEMSFGARGASASKLEELSQFLPPPPPGPQYQPGELAHFEKSAETGDNQSETEEQGYPNLPPAVPLNPGLGFPSQPVPQYSMGGLWGPYPFLYPYFDFRFLTGQYPPGMVSHFSNNFAQGKDFWDDTHYMKAHAPTTSGSEQQIKPFPGDFKDPRPRMQNAQVVSSLRGPMLPGERF